MNCPLISILIPVYQVEPYIERCARSVFEQTYDNLEYIFVDDASPDNSLGILERIIDEYHERKDQIRIIRHPHNKGLAAARNTAVGSCHGRFVFHVDSDDWVERNAVELLVNKQQEADSDIVTGQAIKHYRGTSSPYLSGGWNLEKKELLTQLLTYRVSTTLWRRLIRTSLYTDNDVWANEAGSGGEDFQVLPRLVYYSHHVAGVDTNIYHYNRDNANSFSNNSQILKFQQQGYVSVRVIASFFSDKEDYLQIIVRGLVVRHLFFRMKQNALWGNRQGYEYFRNELMYTHTADFHYILWDKKIQKYIDTHYRSFKFSLFLLKQFRKCRQFVKKNHKLST